LILPLDASLEVGCAYGASCDFGHTAKVGLILPSDVLRSSASRVCLTEASTPPVSVPEPTSGALVLVALAAMYSVTKRGKARPAGCQGVERTGISIAWSWIGPGRWVGPRRARAAALRQGERPPFALGPLRLSAIGKLKPRC